MQDVSVSLGGYRGVRAELLVAFKKAQPVTAHELGAQFGLTPNALRRYLKVLEEDGLVRYRRVVRGLGAPVYAYSLTETGEALFPRTYASALTTALTALREERGSDAVREVFAKEWSALSADAGPLMDTLPLSERAALMAELLTSRGYMAEAVSESDEHVHELSNGSLPAVAGDSVTTLRLFNCSMREIAEEFPEACEAEAQFVSEMLGVPMFRRAHQLRGCRTCEYSTRALSTPCCGRHTEASNDVSSAHNVKLAEEKV
ncbi:MAG: helix-turn-helix domain-containing protein [Gemmatimonadaceae bacterium]